MKESRERLIAWPVGLLYGWRWSHWHRFGPEGRTRCGRPLPERYVTELRESKPRGHQCAVCKGTARPVS